MDISGAVSYALLKPLLRAFISSAKKITDRKYPDYLPARKKQVCDQKIANVKRKLNLLPTGLETRTGLRSIGLIMMVNAKNIKL